MDRACGTYEGEGGRDRNRRCWWGGVKDQKRKKLLLLPKSNRDHSLGFAARSLVTVPTAISQPHILRI